MKSPEERGHPAASWIVEARERLGLSDRQVIALLGKWTDSTLRKAEADSRNLSRPMWRALVDLYQRLAHEQGIALPAPPRFRETPSATVATPDSGALADAVDRLVAVTREQTALLAKLWPAIERQTEAITSLVDARQQGVAPEAVTIFLRQLAAEGLLLVPDTAATGGAHRRRPVPTGG